MNNLNYIGASLMIFDLDSHLNPNSYKKYKKNDTGKKHKQHLQLPPIK
jgi:hypothetical protein